MLEIKAPFTLHRYNFCTGTEGVTVHLRLHCSGAEVVPDSLTIYTVPVAFVNQVQVLLLRIVKEQKYISHVLTTRHSIVRSFLSVLPVSSSCFELYKIKKESTAGIENVKAF